MYTHSNWQTFTHSPSVCETEHFESLLDIDSSHMTYICLMSSGTYCEHIKAE